ncbi:hypothetical protein L0F63_005687, partial [Massospora cicadina]
STEGTCPSRALSSVDGPPGKGSDVQPRCIVHPSQVFCGKSAFPVEIEDHHQWDLERGGTTQPSAGRAALGRGHSAALDRARLSHFHWQKHLP